MFQNLKTELYFQEIGDQSMQTCGIDVDCLNVGP